MTHSTDPTAAPYGAGCAHQPKCPPYGAKDHDAARVVSEHPDQGWSLLCNGVVLFEDTGELSPVRKATDPHRPEPPHVVRTVLDAA